MEHNEQAITLPSGVRCFCYKSGNLYVADKTGGTFVSSEDIPKLYRWLRKVSKQTKKDSK